MLAIKAENISKQYRLGQVGTGTLSHDLNRFYHKLVGKEDPYLKIGEANDRATKGESEYVWSLRDINFEIEQGDAVGIIGKNGAGKSTLLKLLSKVTKPTTGTIHSNGRIASLLEVGTGFHPEMTGRENIYLNGAILGMTRKEITRKFDEIVDFSGVERYIDTPVKRYSSGMYVRLAFAVAAHLESEILIVDEVLAVGDADFQKKCLGKMGDVTKKDGRTILFVSHNLFSVQKLCNKGILLDNGKIILKDNIENVFARYNMFKEYSTDVIPNNNNTAFLDKFLYYDKRDRKAAITTGCDAIFEMSIFSSENVENVEVGIGINDSTETRVITPFSLHTNQLLKLKKGENIITCEIPKFPLKPNQYKVEIYIGSQGKTLDYYDKGLLINIETVRSGEILFIPDASQGSVIILNQEWLTK